MRKNATAKAFVMSVLALMLCLSMLVGTTFAWFTDSVTSGVNKIVAGNLDVELEYAELNDDGSFKAWKPVSSETPLFDQSALWEPGHTEVVYLKISNEGTLSLNYKLAVTVKHEHPGTRYNAEEKRHEDFKLSDYLKFGAVTDWDGRTFYLDRGAAQEAIGEAGKLKDYSTTGSIKASEKETKYIALVVYMPEGVGNEANHISGVPAAVPSIDLGITLEATQMVDENDSFGNDYDKDAFQNDTESSAFVDLTKSEFSVSTEADLLKLADLVLNGQTFEGKTIKIDKNITLAQDNWTPIGTGTAPFKGTFDGGNHTISGLKITSVTGQHAGFFGKVEGATIQDLTVEGNITITDSSVRAMGGICAWAEETTIKNCNNRVNIDVTGYALAAGDTESACVGGIAGIISGEIANCTNYGNITANANESYLDIVAGGISCSDLYGLTWSNCENRGTISGNIYMVGNLFATKPLVEEQPAGE